jgi:Zn-dependent M32 family carboxypeptidase
MKMDKQNKLKRMMGVVIHEVGHNFFYDLNSDERQWTWMKG